MVQLMSDDARAIATALGCPNAHNLTRWQLTTWLTNYAANLSSGE